MSISTVHAISGTAFVAGRTLLKHPCVQREHPRRTVFDVSIRSAEKVDNSNEIVCVLAYEHGENALPMAAGYYQILAQVLYNSMLRWCASLTISLFKGCRFSFQFLHGESNSFGQSILPHHG
jgi:hypothetical protein